MAGLPASDPRMLKAREFVLSRGGALKTRVFTRIFLALFGQVCWDGIPLVARRVHAASLLVRAEHL